MPKNPLSPRLLKRVQMQGGAPGTHPEDGCRCEADLVRTSQRRASAAVPTEGGSPQMGLFQQPEEGRDRIRWGGVSDSGRRREYAEEAGRQTVGVQVER